MTIRRHGAQAPYRHRRFEDDATVAVKLRKAGAILIGKLATVELAGGMGYRQPNASFTGPGLNPWNPKAWSGGSSTGPGDAVAAGLVPFAIGSETVGSIVTPAAYCGITGLRPTFGRVSRHGAMTLSWTLDKIGPMTRSAQDAAIVLSAIAGPDPNDPTTLPDRFRDMDPPVGRPYRIAILHNAADRIQKEVADSFRQSLALLKHFGTLIETSPPDLPYGAATSTILRAEMAAALEDLVGTEDARTLTAPEDYLGGIANGVVFATDYIRALRIRTKAIRPRGMAFRFRCVNPTRPPVRRLAARPLV